MSYDGTRLHCAKRLSVNEGYVAFDPYDFDGSYDRAGPIPYTPIGEFFKVCPHRSQTDWL